MELLRYMFKEGNPIDVAWFVGGAWLLVLFLVILLRQVFRKKQNSGSD